MTLWFSMVLSMGAICAQFNEPGRVHISLGGAFGAHATNYKTEQHFNFFGNHITVDSTTTGGAVSLTVPIELDFGVARFMSLGLYVEPGSYLDSSATESNSIVLAGIQPKFYLLNKDRFALLAALQLGAAGLHIEREEDNGFNSDARYAGLQWGVGTGVAVGFGDHFGMRFMVRYLATNMALRGYEVNGDGVDLDNYEARLKTGGVLFQISLAARFGG